MSDNGSPPGAAAGSAGALKAGADRFLALINPALRPGAVDDLRWNRIDHNDLGRLPADLDDLAAGLDFRQ